MAKKGQGKAVEGEVIDADAALLAAVPELLQTRDDSMTIREWIVSLTPFFTQARALEVKAATRLAMAKTLTKPTNGADDSALQTFIRAASTENKAVVEHWRITSIVFNFQKRLVAVRTRSTKMLDEAASIAQGLHNDYAAAERRRVDDENRRRQQEADAQAERDRQAELDRLETLALKAEATSTDLSERERRYVELMASGLNSPETSARQAGYKDPKTQAERLGAQAKIIIAIQQAKNAIALRRQAEAKRAEPVQSADVQKERADVGGGGVDRTTKSAEIVNARLFIEAVIGGQHGIPADCLMPDAVKLNDYARSLGPVISRWPGIKYVTKTKTV